MVGDLNGKKKAVVSGFVVAFLLCGVFGGLVPVVFGFPLGYTGYGVTYGACGSDAWYYNGTSTSLDVAEGYKAKVLSGYFYGYNASAGTYFGQMAVYNMFGSRVLLSETVVIAGASAGWFECEFPADSYLLNGDYYIGVYANSSQCFVSYGTDSLFNASYSSGQALVSQPTMTAWGAYRISAYVEYEIVSVSDAISVDTSTIGQLGLSAFLIALSVVLALKSRSWAVNFLFGLSLVGYLGWEFANASVELWGGWLDCDTCYRSDNDIEVWSR